MRYISFLLVLFLNLFVKGQSYSPLYSDSLSLETDANPSMKIYEFSTDSLFNIASDHGGTFRVYSDSCGIRKINITVFYSFGVFSTTLYTEYGYIYLVREQEYHYPSYENEELNPIRDYSKPELIFEGDYYRHNLDSVSVITTGERLLMDNFCSLEEFDEFYILATSITQKQ